MLSEQEEYLHLRSIHVDLQERSITFEAEDATATRLVLTPQGILYQLLGASPIAERMTDRLISEADPEPSAGPDSTAAKQKNSSVVLTGKLKTEPKPGRNDAQGHATAWAPGCSLRPSIGALPGSHLDFPQRLR
jgi:hypothetical protein